MKTTSTAANSEGSLSSRDDRVDFKKTFKGFELYSIYLASTLGGFAVGAAYLGPYTGDFIGSAIGTVFGGVFGLLAFITYSKSK